MTQIGIYMPSYNSEKYIEQSIMSIVYQSYTNWKLVIIDDCSEDKTFELASKIRNTLLNSTFSRFRDNSLEQLKYNFGEQIFVERRKSHSGKIGVVKNEALEKLSDCTYVCHVGSDDYIPNYCLQVFVDFMQKNPSIGAACGSFECFDNGGKRWSYPHVINSGEFNPTTMLSYMSMFPMRFYKNETIKLVGGYSNELSSAVDYDLALRISEQVEIKRLLNPITYYYRRHNNQVSSIGKTEQDSNAKIALQNAIDRRKLNLRIINDIPPFKLESIEKESHFIWGKK